MRRFLRLLIVAAAVISAWAAAQATHDVTVRIPDVIGIRIVGAGAGPRAVVFDYATDVPAYLAAVQGGGVLLPTAVQRFSDVQVNANRNGRWSVQVVATPLAYQGSGSGAGLALGDIRIVRGARSGLTQNAITGSGNSAWYLADWPLATSMLAIASRTGSTGGWRSLGFDGRDYQVAVQGDEDAGSFTTTVTYLLTSP